MEAKDRSGVETGYLFSRSQELARWLQLPFLTTSAEDCCRLRPLSHDLRKEPQSRSPRAMSSKEQTRPMLVLSAKNSIPTIAVPAVPIPTNVA